MAWPIHGSRSCSKSYLRALNLRFHSQLVNVETDLERHLVRELILRTPLPGWPYSLTVWAPILMSCIAEETSRQQDAATPSYNKQQQRNLTEKVDNSCSVFFNRNFFRVARNLISGKIPGIPGTSFERSEFFRVFENVISRYEKFRAFRVFQEAGFCGLGNFSGMRSDFRVNI